MFFLGQMRSGGMNLPVGLMQVTAVIRAQHYSVQSRYLVLSFKAKDI
jgi:hypothetical protein